MCDVLCVLASACGVITDQSALDSILGLPNFVISGVSGKECTQTPSGQHYLLGHYSSHAVEKARVCFND